MRAIARDLYRSIADRPILSPHGHVPSRLLALDEPFADPAELFIVHDHYVTRLLHAAGVPLTDLGVGVPPEQCDSRAIWRAMARNWHLFAGTATGYWIEESLSSVFGVDDDLSEATADRIHDQLLDQLAEPAMRPRALWSRFGIEFLATTDDPLDSLEHHRQLRESGLPGRVAPTFRPDRYLDPGCDSFGPDVERLLAATGAPATFRGYLRALEQRRRYFIEHGAVSTDHGVTEPLSVDLEPADAERLFQLALAGRADAAESRRFRAHMLLQMARMSVDDGLVMTVHAGVRRNHNAATFGRFGADTGHDIPIPTTFTDGLRPLLNRFGLHPNLHLVLFTVDESTFSRELAPLAGFYPSVHIGAPWWFLDAPESMARFRSAVTEIAGFYRTSGFIDDTRAFLSIPARHDTARRVDAGYLARLVAEGRVSITRAQRIIEDLVGAIPRRVFKL